VLSVVLPQVSRQVSSMKNLTDPEVLDRIASAAMADQKYSDGLFPALTTEQARAVTEEVCKQFVQRTIAIPTLTITPKQQVSFGFRRFDLDLKKWDYQPLSRELLIQILRTEKQTKLSSDAGGEAPERPEDYLVSRLMDFPEIDYDTHADILYDLAGQVVSHFAAKHSDKEQLRSVIQGHARRMADAMFAQMKQHMWREQTNYRVTVTAAFAQLRPQAFDSYGQGSFRDFRSPPERLIDIKRFVFGGFAKSCYPLAKFDSDTERKLSVILEQDNAVNLWMKPGPNQFKIFDTEGLPYQPDFVVETETTKLIIETKANNQMTDTIVLRKADSASVWCHIATEFHGKRVQDKPWAFLLVPDSAVVPNATIDGLVATYRRSPDTHLLSQYDFS
jgi:type III restriction enzyme